MAKVLVEVDDKFIDWDAWARSQLANGGLANTVASASEEPAQEEAKADPWKSGNATQAAPEATETAQQGTIHISTPSGPQTVTLAPSGGPPCNCGDPAALFVGKAQKSGKTWRQYRCAKSAGDDWKSKCEFSQWA